MPDASLTAHKYLSSMSKRDQQQLFNTLIGLDATHCLNCNTSFYSYRNLKKIFRSKKSQEMQSVLFVNERDEKLVIKQFKDSTFLKNSYRIEVLINNELYDYHLIDELLVQLNQQFCENTFSYA
ncbi:hypothetical protein [Enterococcus hermanniensis]|nr:hypothetical protein [Enterococcus hermanniensis]